jgi:hypothetical protein
VHFHRREFAIVKPGAPQLLVVQVEAKRRNEVQLRAGVCRTPNDIPSIGWDLRLDQNM